MEIEALDIVNKYKELLSEEQYRNVLLNLQLEQLQSELKDLQEQFKGQGKEIEN